MTGYAEPGASRDGYGDALLDMAGDDRVVVLEADLGKSTKSCHFRAEYPERTFCLGIAEQNMALVGAGLAEGEGPLRQHLRYLLGEGLRAVQERDR